MWEDSTFKRRSWTRPFQRALPSTFSSCSRAMVWHLSPLTSARITTRWWKATHPRRMLSWAISETTTWVILCWRSLSLEKVKLTTDCSNRECSRIRDMGMPISQPWQRPTSRMEASTTHWNSSRMESRHKSSKRKTKKTTWWTCSTRHLESTILRISPATWIWRHSERSTCSSSSCERSWRRRLRLSTSLVRSLTDAIHRRSKTSPACT